MKPETRSLTYLPVLWALAVLVMVSVSPALHPTPPRDPAFYQFAGERLLAGERLYVELWDHKPPLIHHLNALGLLLGGGSQWGIWGLEVLSLAAAVLMAYLFLQRRFAPLSVFLGISAGLAFFLQVLQGGDYTEEFALPLQVAAAAAFFAALDEERSRRGLAALACGLVLGGLFSLRPNLIGVAAALIAVGLWYLLVERHRIPWRLWLSAAAGAGIVVSVMVGYILWRSEWGEFWRAVFVYNRVYTALGLRQHIRALGGGLVFVLRSPLGALAVLAWLAALLQLVRRRGADVLRVVGRRRVGAALLVSGVLAAAGALAVEWLPSAKPGLGAGQLLALALAVMLALASGVVFRWGARWQNLAGQPRAGDMFWLLLLVWLPAELVLATLSGRMYLHYFQPLTAPLMFLFAGVFDRVHSHRGRYALWGAVLVLGVLVFPIVPLTDLYAPSADAQTQAAADFLRRSSPESERVLVWGAEPLVYSLAQRLPPTRFAYLYPLLIRHPLGMAYARIFAQEIQALPPLWVLDTLDRDFPRLTEVCAGEASAPENLGEALTFLCATYRPAGRIGPEEWVLFRRRP